MRFQRELIVAQVAKYERRLQIAVEAEVHRQLASYLTHDEAAALQQEINNLRSIIADRSREVCSHHRNAPSERTTSPEPQGFEVRQPRHRAQTSDGERALRKRPTAYGLVELKPSDTRFKGILSYRRYRLSNTENHTGSDFSRNIGV